MGTRKINSSGITKTCGSWPAADRTRGKISHFVLVLPFGFHPSFSHSFNKVRKIKQFEFNSQSQTFRMILFFILELFIITNTLEYFKLIFYFCSINSNKLIKLKQIKLGKQIKKIWLYDTKQYRKKKRKIDKSN